MDIFIGNLPAKATLFELTRILDGIEIRADFERHEGRDHEDRDYHYFIARTRDTESGRALIDRLNGLVFSGQVIESHEFRTRASQSSWRGVERRVNAV